MGKSKKITYYDYHISWLHSFCHGPVDELKQIWLNEKPLLADDDALTTEAKRSIDKPDLFGDYEREGGVVGDLYWMPGPYNQKIPTALAQRVAANRDDYPGYRGLANIFFCGEEGGDHKGMKVASNSPRVPTTWARMHRASTGLPGNTAVIVSDDGYRNSNPANMVFEVLTNRTWGMGGSIELLNMDMLQAAAATLFDEDFGLSILWTKQSTAEDFIQEICDHVQGMLYFNPFTGLIDFKLIRNDYDKNTLPEVGPDTAKLMQFRRPLWGETVNEITVTWTRPKTEQEETITFQDIGNIAMQGEVVSENRNYYGIRTRKLAQYVGERDIVSAASPLVTAQIKVNRREWNYLPGQCIRFTWPAHGIVRMVMRVMHIDWGRPDNAEITVDLMEDVFAAEYAEFGPPGEEEWTDPRQDPDSDIVENIPVKFVAPPYSVVQQLAAESSSPIDIGDDRYPEIIIGALMSPLPKDEDYEGQEDVQSFIMNVPDVLPNGDPTWTSAGEKTLTGRAKLTVALTEEVTSILEFDERYGGPGPAVGGIAVIGTEATDEWVEEWVLVTQKISTTRWRVQRGILDTIPRDWGVGSVVWFIGPDSDVYDPSARIANENELYKLQPRTSGGIRKLALVPVSTTTRPDRVYRPYRPANCKIENVMFGTEDQSQQHDPAGEGDDYDHVPRDFTITVSWANRHREMEDTIFRKWDDGNVAPEAGQTTEIIVFAGLNRAPAPGVVDPAQSGEITRITGLTGTSATFDIRLETAQYEALTLMFISRRNGLQSLQGMCINLKLYFKGYGYDWGWMYGGWPDGTILTTIDDSPHPQQMPGFTSTGEVLVEEPVYFDTPTRYAPGAPGDRWPRYSFRRLATRRGLPSDPHPWDSKVNIDED